MANPIHRTNIVAKDKRSQRKVADSTTELDKTASLELDLWRAKESALAVAAALSSGTLAAGREADSRLHGHPPPPRRPGIIPSQKLWGRRAVVRARRVKPRLLRWARELRALARVRRAPSRPRRLTGPLSPPQGLEVA